MNRRLPLRLVNRVTFALSWSLVTLNMFQTHGLFTDPLLFHISIAGNHYPIGAILLVPTITLATMAMGKWRATASGRWELGRAEMLLPVAGMGLLILIRSWPVHRTAVLIPSLVCIGLFWGVYAYTLQSWPATWLVAALSALALLHGTVATLQFAHQSSLGLTYLGELALDPQVRGASVIELAGQRWLRAYGLLPHPNVLGGMMGIALLVCLGDVLQESGTPLRRIRMARRIWLWAAVTAAAAGLLLSFSRSAWLGTGLGLLLLASATRLWQRLDWRAPGIRWLLAGIVLAVFVISAVFGRLIIARLGGGHSELEQASVSERVRDSKLAWMLIRHVPLKGVGAGYYIEALWAWAQINGLDYPAFQDVHNVPLLAGAELGVAGLALWVWLVSVPVAHTAWAAWRGSVPAARARWGAVFLLIGVVAMLDSYPYLLHFRSAALMGAVCGIWAQPLREGVANGA